MSSADGFVRIATRGSALALAQANSVMASCRSAFPELRFALEIIKTTGDKLQTASLAQEGKSLPKGLFTKELETALLENKADLAVHSLKDLPTELPVGLVLGAVNARADVRDVLVYRSEGCAQGHRGFPGGLLPRAFPPGAVVATSSTRRKAQLLVQNPALKLPDIRGNVLTRLQKLAEQSELDGTVLALAGLTRLDFQIDEGGSLKGQGVPQGLLATILEVTTMLPCVGQGALGIEIRGSDEKMAGLCRQLNHSETWECVTAERTFLAAMGGGCQSPVAAHAEVIGNQLRLRAISFAEGPMHAAEARGPRTEPARLGAEVAARLKPNGNAQGAEA